MESIKVGRLEIGHHVFYGKEWRRIANIDEQKREGEGRVRVLYLVPNFGHHDPVPVSMSPESKIYYRETKPKEPMDKWSE